MVEQTLSEKISSGPAGRAFEQAAATRTAADQTGTTGPTSKDTSLKDKAAELANSSREAVSDHAADFVAGAKGVGAQATDRLRETIDGQRGAGADYVGGLAEALRRAASEFDNELPIAGTYIRKAASQVDSVSESVRNGEFNELLRSAQSFARRQPTAFLGMAVLAGFGVIRFLKSSANSNFAGQAGSSVGSHMHTDANRQTANRGQSQW